MPNANNTQNSNGNSTGRKLEWLKDFQFKPGQTGNPGGRPKEQKPLRSMLLAYLQGLDDQELKKLEKWAKRKKKRKNDQEPQTWTRTEADRRTRPPGNERFRLPDERDPRADRRQARAGYGEGTPGRSAAAETHSDRYSTPETPYATAARCPKERAMTSFTMVLLSQVISVRYDFHTYVTILVGISSLIRAS